MSVVGIPVALLLGCTPTLHKNGWIPQEDALAQIKPGTSTKMQVATLLGTPTLTSTFGEEAWYYVARTTQSQTSFARPKLLSNDIWAFSFNEHGIVRCLEILSKEDVRKIEPIARETDAKGYNVSVFKQMFKNLGRMSAGGTKR